MNINKEFIKIKEKHIEQLNMFVPIVNRVHGKSHPEFNDVKRIFDRLNKKLKNNEYDLTLEFDELTKITSNYQVPSDVCESYEAVYQMLKELDCAYRNENK